MFNIFGYLSKHLELVLVLDNLEIDPPEEDFIDEDWSDTIYGADTEEMPSRMPMP